MRLAAIGADVCEDPDFEGLEPVHGTNFALMGKH